MDGSKIIYLTAKACVELGIELQEVWVSYSSRVVYTYLRNGTKHQDRYFYDRMMDEDTMYKALVEALSPLATGTAERE